MQKFAATLALIASLSAVGLGAATVSAEAGGRAQGRATIVQPYGRA